MNLLDRHIFKSVLFTCVGAISLFAFVLMLGNVLRDLLPPLLTGQLGWGIAVQLLLIMPLTVAQFALPMGILTGVLLTLGRISADSEIVAMRSAGLGVVRIARPIFILGVLGGLLCLFTNFYAFPEAKVKYERDLASALRRDPLSFVVPKTFIRAFKGCVIYVGEKEGAELRDIWIWELDDQRRVKRFVRAESGRLEFDEASNSLIPSLVHAKTEERNSENPEDFSKSPKAPSVEKAEEVRLSLERYFGRDRAKVKPEWLTYPQLQDERQRLAAQTPPPEKIADVARERMKLELVIQDKFNLAFAAFSFAFIAVPLGIKVSRRETSANLGLALLLVLGYYFLTVMVKWLDRHPEYRPDLLLWLPNVLFIALGVWLFRRIEK